MNSLTGTTDHSIQVESSFCTPSRVPLISIITVCRNSAATIHKTSASILEQQNQDWEWLVIDGASTDNTCDIVRVMFPSDPRVRITSEPDNGIFDAMNKGIATARGLYINFLNSDDRYAGDRVLEEVAAALQQRPETDFLYGNIHVEAADGSCTIHKPPGPEAAADEMVCGCLPHQASFARRTLFNPECIGLFDVNLRYGADYKWMMDVLADSSHQVQYLDKELAFFYTGGNSSYLEGCLPESFRILNGHSAFQKMVGLPRLLQAYQKQVFEVRSEVAKLRDEVLKQSIALAATRSKLTDAMRLRDDYKMRLKGVYKPRLSPGRAEVRFSWLPSWLRFWNLIHRGR